MKKLLIGVCAISLLITSTFVVAQSTATNSKDYASTSATANRTVLSNAENTEKTSGDKTPTPVETTAKDAHYNKKKGNRAAGADLGLSALSAAFAVMSLLSRFELAATNFMKDYAESLVYSSASVLPGWLRSKWFHVFISVDPVGLFTQLGHAAVNKFMRDATNITASFTGDQGHVTDKWVGPPSQNKTVLIMGDVGIKSRKFPALSFNKDNYPKLKDADKADAATLAEYRANELLENQRSLANVTTENWGLIYRAQKRSILGLAGALELKSQLDALSKVEQSISAEYKTKPQALNTVAARRVLHDALLLLKVNVMAARTRLRSEVLELDFKPKTTTDEEEEENNQEATRLNKNNVL